MASVGSVILAHACTDRTSNGIRMGVLICVATAALLPSGTPFTCTLIGYWPVNALLTYMVYGGNPTCTLFTATAFNWALPLPSPPPCTPDTAISRLVAFSAKRTGGCAC